MVDGSAATGRGMAIFKSRRDAGIRLADEIQKNMGGENTIILAIPRGGLPVANEISKKLRVPLDIFMVQRLSVPRYQDIPLGSVSSGGASVINDFVVDLLDIPAQVVRAVTEQGRIELERKEAVYRQAKRPATVQGKTAILVDDGLATGMTMRAAVSGLRRLNPAQILVTVPVASPGTLSLLAPEVDRIFCLATPHPFYSIGSWYQDFARVSEAEVQAMLAQPDSPQPFTPEARPPDPLQAGSIL